MDYLEPYLEQLGLLPSADDAAVALSRQQAVKLRDDCLAELKQRLVDQANLIQTAFDKVLTHSLTVSRRPPPSSYAVNRWRWGRGEGAQAHPNRGHPPQYSRTLDTLWPVASQQN